jgi:ABC-type uncharacterized transport system substrate-binding protein
MLVGLLCLLPASAMADKLSLYIVFAKQDDAYARVYESFRQSGQGQQWNLHSISHERLASLPQNNIDAYVAVGSAATRSVLQYRQSQPLLAVMLTRSAYLALSKQSNNPSTFSAITLEQSPARHIALAQVLLPNARVYGLPAGPKEQSVLDEYLHVLEKIDVFPQHKIIAKESQAAKSIEYLLEDGEVIIALPDAPLMKANTAKWLLYMSYQHSVPVIAFSNAYVKAGALAAVYSEPEHYGEQMVQWFEQYFSTRNSPESTYIYPHEFSVSINSWVAKSMNIPVADQQIITDQVKALSRKLSQ